jgi:hypothetical protein
MVRLRTHKRGAAIGPQLNLKSVQKINCGDCQRFGRTCSSEVIGGMISRRGRWCQEAGETMPVRFKGAHVPQEIMLMGVRWSVASPLSDRHVEELMEERGVSVDYATVQLLIDATPTQSGPCSGESWPYLIEIFREKIEGPRIMARPSSRVRSSAPQPVRPVLSTTVQPQQQANRVGLACILAICRKGGNAEELRGLSVQESKSFSRTGLAALWDPE